VEEAAAAAEAMKEQAAKLGEEMAVFRIAGGEQPAPTEAVRAPQRALKALAA